MSDYPVHLSLLNNICGGWTFEQRFHPVRKWRFDFAHHWMKVAIEIEGGIFTKGKSGHTTGKGYKLNMEKYNEAAMLGGRFYGICRSRWQRWSEILKESSGNENFNGLRTSVHGLRSDGRPE